MRYMTDAHWYAPERLANGSRFYYSRALLREQGGHRLHGELDASTAIADEKQAENQAMWSVTG